MKKKHQKKFAMIMALIFAFTMIFPLTGTAAASDAYTALRVPVVPDNATGVELGTVFVEIPAGALADGHVATLRLSGDVEFGSDVKETTVSDAVYNRIHIPEAVGGDDNALWNHNISTRMINDDEVLIEVEGDITSGEKAFFYLYLPDIDIDSAPAGEITLTVTAPSDSGFPSGDVVIGKVAGSDGEVAASVTRDSAITEEGIFTLRLEEDVAGAFDDEDTAINIKLPDGFSFAEITGDDIADEGLINDIDFEGDGSYITGEYIWGDSDIQNNLFVNLHDGADEMDINLSAATEDATCLGLSFKIQVDDETDAAYGDIEVDLTGSDSVIKPGKLIVGTYADYEAAIEAAGVPTVKAGFDEQEIAEITIKESAAGSLVQGRTILLTLPTNARWHADTLKDFDSENGLEIEFESLTGTNNCTAKFIVARESNDAAEVTLKNVEVFLKANEVGDLVIEVGGSAGLSGEITVAQIVRPIEITNVNPQPMKIGLADQTGGDIIIKEVEADTINEGILTLAMKPFAEYAQTPQVEVIEGDLEIGSVSIRSDAGGDRFLDIEIKDESTEISSIKITDVKIMVDRAAPEGYIGFKAYNTAVVDRFTLGTWPNFYYATTGVFGVNKTPAPEEKILTTTITLGDNGSYISDGRIMVQLRDAAKALGVAEQNILWDNATKTVTFIGSESVAQITVGDPQVKLNGMTLPTDKGGEIKDGRTYVSLSAAGIALGAVTTWDNETKTATLTVK